MARRTISERQDGTSVTFCRADVHLGRCGDDSWLLVRLVPADVGTLRTK